MGKHSEYDPLKNVFVACYGVDNQRLDVPKEGAMGRLRRTFVLLVLWAASVVAGANAGLSQCSQAGSGYTETCFESLSCGRISTCATTICENGELCPDKNVQLECNVFGCTFASNCGPLCCI